MRTTIRLDDQLLAEAKRLAFQIGRTLTAVIEDALREAIARHHKVSTRKRTRLIADSGRGLCPGIYLDDNARLLGAMEGRHLNYHVRRRMPRGTNGGAKE